MNITRINNKKYRIIPKTINAQNLTIDDILISPSGSRYKLNAIKSIIPKDADDKEQWDKGMVLIRGTDKDTGRPVRWTMKDGDRVSIYNKTTGEGLSRKSNVLPILATAGMAAVIANAYRKAKKEIKEEDDRQRDLEIARGSNRLTRDTKPAVATTAVSSAYKLPVRIGFKSTSPGAIYDTEAARNSLGLANAVSMSEGNSDQSIAQMYRSLKQDKEIQE